MQDVERYFAVGLRRVAAIDPPAGQLCVFLIQSRPDLFSVPICFHARRGS
jgi:hypothetical protein